MFVSHAKVRIAGLGARSRKKRPHRRRLAVKEVVRMPCLIPTVITVFLGLLAVAGGAGMSVIGYIPSYVAQNLTNSSSTNIFAADLEPPHDTKYYTLKTCSYLGPIIMAIGTFAMIMSCVFYCEILDKYAILVPDKKSAIFDREELYEVIVGEMKKSYAQTLVTAYSKAAERSLLIDNQSSSGDFLPEPIFPYKPNEPMSIEQQIDIECEGYAPSPPIPHKRYSVIQARIQRLRSEDNWLKTSSLPNIGRSMSIKRAGRVSSKIKDSRTLSYDYTMDEARLRRKSMMLRSIVHWNSGSSGELGHRQRRFSSVKGLPSEQPGSLEELSHSGYGSFPMTRLIQRRGTFACGDMRTRRMKFLLLLQQATDSTDSMSTDGRPPVDAIRRNSFVPYNTCDKFISGEEKKTIRDSRRPSVNPFMFSNRFGNTIPQPGTRRHSFFPIRRESKIYNADPYEQRRHSFNPIGVNNTLKQEYGGKSDSRRASFNPDSLPDRASERRPSRVPQSSRFLQVPGCEQDMYTERRPSVNSDNFLAPPKHTVSDSGFNHYRTGNPQAQSYTFQNDRQVERRHSFNPVVRLPPTNESEECSPSLKVPKITINAVSSDAPPGHFLTVPSQEHYTEERERSHSFNIPGTTKSASSTAASLKPIEKPTPQRISFRLGPDSSSSRPSPSSSQTSSKGSRKPSKTTSDVVRPSSFKQEMVVFKPLPYPDSRSVSPSSNISCCGSERLGSERSLKMSRTMSVGSDSSAKKTLTSSQSSAVAADGVQSYGTFEKTSPKLSRRASLKNKDSNPKRTPTKQPSSQTEVDVSMETTVPPSSSHPRLIRKSASFRDTRGRGRGSQHNVLSDSPGSTCSGPATLSPSTITDANAAIQRSKSASALPAGGAMSTLSPLPTSSYARVPRKPSPLAASHKTLEDKHSDVKYS